jgi:hypothetical protein
VTSPGYYGGISERMLVESGRGAPGMSSSNDRSREINVDSFLNPNGFAIVNLLPKGIVSLHNTSLIRY